MEPVLYSSLAMCKALCCASVCVCVRFSSSVSMLAKATAKSH